MKYLIIFMAAFFHNIVLADLIRLNCVHSNSYSFVVQIDTIKQSVILNDSASMDNVTINNSIIKFDMKSFDPNLGTHFAHQINRTNGKMSVKIEPNGNLDYYQCEKIISNKF